MMKKSHYIRDVEENTNTNNQGVLRSTWTSCHKTRRVTLVMRSAERVDRIFGTHWCRTEKLMNKVNATDLNMPVDAHLHPSVYEYNPPITNIGKYSMQLVARALKNRAFNVSVIICSPTLRSVQTAAAIAKSFGARICIEPGLLEPMEWYRNAGAKELPDFVGGQLLEAYPVDKNYRPIFSCDEMSDAFPIKNQDQCIQRISLVLRNICGTQRDHTALVVGHAITMDIASRIGQHGDQIDPQSLDECTSYEDPVYRCETNSQASKLELGVKYPPGAIMGLTRINDSPPYVLQTVNDLIPPLTSATYSNNIFQ